MCDLPPTKAFSCFLLPCPPSTHDDPRNHRKKTGKTLLLEARASIRYRLSGVLGVWVASLDLVSADLHDGALGPHQASVDRRLRPFLYVGLGGDFSSSLGFSRYNGYGGPPLKTVVVRDSDRA